MNYNLTSNGHVENFTQGHGHDQIEKGHVEYQSIRNRQPEHIYVFYRSSLSQSKGIAEKLLVTFHDLK